MTSTETDTHRHAAHHLFVEAEVHYQHGRPQTAISFLRDALRLDPDFHVAHRRIWEIHASLGNLPRIIRAFRAALAARLKSAPLATSPVSGPHIEYTTLCAVDCLNPELSVAALLRSTASCKFDSVKLLTDQAVSAPGIEVVAIPTITSTEDYSHFMTKKLLHYIDTDHMLYVQWDGFIIDPNQWDNSFLLYDYIGARWPEVVLPDSPDHAVGNGGFSLRSRALLDALQDDEIKNVHPEDNVICRRYRPYLERRYGIAFADNATADRFSSEHCALEQTTFGFHGVLNLGRHLPWPEFQCFDFFD